MHTASTTSQLDYLSMAAKSSSLGALREILAAMVSGVHPAAATVLHY